MAKMVQDKSKSGKVVRMPVVNALRQAELRAKKRDAQLTKKATEKAVNLPAVDREEAKAQAMTPRHTIVKVREKSRTPFVQLVVDNFYYLLKRNYLTTAEKSFILSLMVFVELNSNALTAVYETEEGCEKTHGVLKITDMAKSLKLSLWQTRRLVNQLIKKGILYEFVDTETLKTYGRPVEERPLFFNPEIVFAGDKNRINLTLCRLHWSNDRLEKRGLKLPWKIWYAPGCEHGKLYRRKTWLKKKQAIRSTGQD